MNKDIKDFVWACTVFAVGKTTNTHPNPLLQPLPIPS